MRERKKDFLLFIKNTIELNMTSLSSSSRVRNEFRFDFGSVPVPRHSRSHSSHSSAKISLMPDNMTAQDHQLIGEYGTADQSYSVKITYNHTKVNGSPSVEHHLLNPFALSIGHGISTKYFVRDTPDKLFMISMSAADDMKCPSLVEYERKGICVEQKCNFAFNSIRNLFDHLRCSNGKWALSFHGDSVTRTERKLSTPSAIEQLNPLCCRTVAGPLTSWFIMDIPTMSLIEIVVNGGEVARNVYDITGIPEKEKTLLLASEYFSEII